MPEDDYKIRSDGSGIRVRILTPLVAAMLFLMCAFFYFSFQYQTRAVQDELGSRLQSIQHVFFGTNRAQTRQMHSVVEAITINDALVVPWLERDTAQLNRVMRPFYRRLREDFRIDEIYLHDTTGQLVRKYHQDEQDYVASDECRTIARAISSGEPVEGLELEEDGTLKLCVVHPWEYEGKLVGYIQVDRDTDDILADAAEILGVDLAVTIHRDVVEEDQWSAALERSRDLNEDGGERSTLVLASTSDSLPAPIKGLLTDPSREPVTAFEGTHFYRSGGRELAVRLTGLHDSSNRPFGEIAVIYDYTTRWRQLMSDLRWLIVVSVIVIAALYVIFFVLLGRFEKDLARAQQDVRETSERERANQRRYLAQSEREKEALAESEASHRQSRARIAALMASVPSTIVEIDRTGRIVYVNRSSPESIWENSSGRPIVEFLHQSSHGRFENALARLFQYGARITIEVTGRSESPWQVTLLPIKYENRFDTALAVFEDLSEGRETEERLRWMEAAVSAAEDGVAVADLDGKIQYVNEAWCRMHGWTRDELAGKDISIFHTPEQMESEVGPFTREAWQQGLMIGDIGHVRRDGSEFPCRMTAQPIRDEAGTARAILGIARDTSRERQAEAELWESQTRFERLASNFPGMVYQFKLERDGTMSFPYASRGAIEIFGAPATEIMKDFELVLGAVHEDDIERIRASITESAENLTRWEETFRVVVDGREYYCRGLSRPRALINGDVVWDGVLFDVTDQQQSEDTLAKTLAQLEAVLDSARHVAIVATNEEGRVTLFNSGAEKLLGYRPSEVIGRKTANLFFDKAELAVFLEEAGAAEVNAGDPMAPFVTARESGQHDRVWRFVRQDGSLIEVSVVTSPLRTNGEHINGYLIMAVDISEQVRVRKELAQINMDLRTAKEMQEANSARLVRLIRDLEESAEQVKQYRQNSSLRLAALGTEFLRPVHSTTMMAGLLLDEATTERQREYSGIILDNLEKLSEMTRNLQDYFLAEAGRLEPEQAEFSLQALLDEALDEVAGLAADRKVSLMVRQDQRLPIRATGDPNRLRRLLSFLLGETIAGLRGMDLIVEASLESISGIRSAVRISLLVDSDGSGNGVELSSETVVAKPELKAGSVLAERLLEPMKGVFWEEPVVGSSECGSPGRGCHMLIDLLPSAGPGGYGYGLSTAAPIVQVVVANERIGREIGDFLRDWGVDTKVTVHEVGTAPELLSDMSAVVVEESVLVSLTGFAGSDMERVVGENRLVIVGSSPGDASPYEIRPGQLVSLPVRAGELYRALRPALIEEEAAVEWRESGSTHAEDGNTGLSSEADSRSHRSRILVLESDEVNSRLACTLLARHDFEVIAENHGAQGLERLREGNVDLALVDFDLSDMTGPDLVVEWRREEGREVDCLPFIGVDAEDSVDNREVWAKAGVDETISKPYEPAALISIVSRLVRAGGQLRSGVPGSKDDSAFWGRRTRRILDEMERAWGLKNRERLEKLATELREMAQGLDGKEVGEVSETLPVVLEAGDWHAVSELLRRLRRMAASSMAAERPTEVRSG